MHKVSLKFLVGVAALSALLLPASAFAAAPSANDFEDCNKMAMAAAGLAAPGDQLASPAASPRMSDKSGEPSASATSSSQSAGATAGELGEKGSSVTGGTSSTSAAAGQPTYQKKVPHVDLDKVVDAYRDCLNTRMGGR